MRRRAQIDPIVRHSIESELRVNGPHSGAELSSKLGIPRQIVDRVLGEFLSAGTVTFDARTNCYSWVRHDPKLST